MAPAGGDLSRPLKRHRWKLNSAALIFFLNPIDGFLLSSAWILKFVQKTYEIELVQGAVFLRLGFSLRT